MASAGGLLEESGRHFAERTGAEAARIGEHQRIRGTDHRQRRRDGRAGDAFAGAVAHFGTANERRWRALPASRKAWRNRCCAATNNSPTPWRRHAS